MAREYICGEKNANALFAIFSNLIYTKKRRVQKMKRNLKLKLFVTSCFAAMLALSSCNVTQEPAASISEEESSIAENNADLEQEIADRDKEIEQLKEQLERLQEDAAKAESEAQASSEAVSKLEVSQLASSAPLQTSSAPLPPSSSVASASSQVSSSSAASSSNPQSSQAPASSAASSKPSSSSSQSSSVAQSSSQAVGITGSSDSSGITFSFGGSGGAVSNSSSTAQNGISHERYIQIVKECAEEVGLEWDDNMKVQGGFDPGVTVDGRTEEATRQSYRNILENYAAQGNRSAVYGEITMSRHGYYVFVLYR